MAPTTLKFPIGSTVHLINEESYTGEVLEIFDDGDFNVKFEDRTMRCHPDAIAAA